MQTIEFSVARVERDGSMRRHASLACWPDPAPAYEYMRWMNTDLYRAMQEQAAEEGPDSPFSKWFTHCYEGTECVVVSRDVGEWLPVPEGEPDGSH